MVWIRPARPEDIPALFALVDAYARRGLLLPRSEEEIAATLSDWIVAEAEGRMVGCGSLVWMSPTLVEIRSLAVAEDYQGNGAGGAIVQALVRRARAAGARVVFALTRAVPFFERLGFAVTERERFPEKVWRDCVRCPLRERCDEVAVVYAFPEDEAGAEGQQRNPESRNPT
jgi:amino-acid N-acetyltransferase